MPQSPNKLSKQATGLIGLEDKPPVAGVLKKREKKDLSKKHNKSRLKRKIIKKKKVETSNVTESELEAVKEIRSILEVYQQSFENEAHCYDEIHQVYFPTYFDPHNATDQTILAMTNYYKKYGFVVLRDPTSNGMFDSQNPKAFWTNQHAVEINAHLDNVFNSSSENEEKNQDEFIIKNKRYPMKLNIGLINGTLYSNSQNTNTCHPHRDADTPYFNSEYSNTSCINNTQQNQDTPATSGDLHSLDDSISQSVSTWVLRASCLPSYTSFYNSLVAVDSFSQQSCLSELEDPHCLISSIEDSTCMFSASSRLSKLQSDSLHFLPGLISERKIQKEKRNIKDAADAMKIPLYMSGKSFLNHLTFEERCKWPRGFLSTSKDNSSFSFVPGFHNVFPKLKQYMDNKNYGSKRTSTRAIPPPELNLDSNNEEGMHKLSKRILLQEGDLLIYHPTFVTKLEANLSNEHHAYGLKVMFFNPQKRGFGEYDYSTRTMAAAHSYVNNDERVFGQPFFLKRRGMTFLLNGDFKPKINRLLYPNEELRSMLQNETMEKAYTGSEHSILNTSDNNMNVEELKYHLCLNKTLFYWARNIIDAYFTRSLVQ